MKLIVLFKRFSGCWINSQWKCPRRESTSVIPAWSISWTAQPFVWGAAPERRAAKHSGYTWHVWKRFCQSSCVIVNSLSSRIESMEFQYRRAAPFIISGKERDKQKMKMRDASLDSQPKILSYSVEETLRRIMGKTNNGCRFQIFISQIPYTSQVCLLEDKIQDFIHKFLRKRCIGSKKWKWLTHWMI